MKAFRKRYLKIRVLGENADESFARKTIQEAFLHFLGEEKTARLRYQFIRFEQPFAIIPISHEIITEAVAALAFARTFQGRDIALRVEKTSGTLLALTGKRRPKK